MGWLKDLLTSADDNTLTFSQDLELLIARWTDRSKKKDQAMTNEMVGNALLNKAEEILERHLATAKTADKKSKSNPLKKK